MYRSGSTWLYNAVRLVLTRATAPGLAAGLIADKDTLLIHETPVVKIHAFDEDLAARSGTIVLTSHRDLRDIIASLQRKFKMDFALAPLRETVESHARWSAVAAFDLHYEDLLVNRVLQVRKVAEALQLSPATLAQLHFESISEEIDSERFLETRRACLLPYDLTNLLHEGHITDGRHGSWKGYVPDEIVKAIETEFRPWLEARGYPI
jgi:hypothetical protein